MMRFCGMMPFYEIEISKLYKDEFGLPVQIDAGKNGWTIIYADSSTEYKDVTRTAEENFQEAYEVASSHMSLTPYKNSSELGEES